MSAMLREFIRVFSQKELMPLMPERAPLLCFAVS